MDEPKETTFYEGGPTVEPGLGEDAWFDEALMGKADIDPNNDLSGGDDGSEVE